MAEDMEFDSFDNLDDLDWSELEKDLQDKPPEQAPEAGKAADAGGAPAADGGEVQAGKVGSGSSQTIEIGYLLDVNLQVTVEVGKTQALVSKVLTWDRGSVIELNKVVGQTLNLLINNKSVAKGEVVVVNEKFALKITEILDPQDRMNYLQS
ncbi:MAG: FliM/FliN family flagellar motor switch protein [bacterium]